MDATPSQHSRSVGDYLKDAWGLMDGLKWNTIILLGFSLLAYWIATILVTLSTVPVLLAVPSLVPHDPKLPSLPFILIIAIPYIIFYVLPELIGWVLLTMYVNKILGRPHTIKHVMSLCYAKLFPLVKLCLAINLLNYIYQALPTFLYSTMPSNPSNVQVILYLSIIVIVIVLLLELIIPVNLFSAMLIVFRNQSASEALMKSYEVINGWWKHVLILLALLGAVMTAGAFTLGVFLIWGLPWAIMYAALIVRDACGLDMPAPKETVPPEEP